jgi:hypothetical protein
LFKRYFLPDLLAILRQNMGPKTALASSLLLSWGTDAKSTDIAVMLSSNVGRSIDLPDVTGVI